MKAALALACDRASGLFLLAGALDVGLRFLACPAHVEATLQNSLGVLWTVAVARLIYLLVDVFDAWLGRITARTANRLDNMLVPLVRTSLRGCVILLAAMQVITQLSDKPVTSLIAGLGVIFQPSAVLQLLLMIIATSFAFNAMMFMMMVRVEDPLVPRAMFGILNTLLYFPSGAVYPIAAFPGWLRVLARIDPFTYAVHGFKSVLLKEAGFQAMLPDLLFLLAIGTVAMLLAIRLFKRSL